MSRIRLTHTEFNRIFYEGCKAMGIEPENYFVRRLWDPPFFSISIVKEAEPESWREDKDWSNPFKKNKRLESDG